LRRIVLRLHLGSGRSRDHGIDGQLIASRHGRLFCQTT
jgi:hypothetical protein